MSNLLYPACGEEKESVYHFLQTLNAAWMQNQYSIFGSYLLRTGRTK